MKFYFNIRGEGQIFVCPAKLLQRCKSKTSFILNAPVVGEFTPVPFFFKFWNVASGKINITLLALYTQNPRTYRYLI